MRKKNVLAVIDSLEQINNAVARNLESNIPVETETLADCQDAALEVGNKIEKRGQEGEEIVHLLEAYCENIYRMNCVQTDISQCRKLAKKIQKQLVQIRNRVKYDLPDDKRQVVFLPYKASMWDSLESVWKAADADPDCDAYVIPIPYFDKNPDGSFREMHYEGDQYPDYVPVVSWEEYDIEAEHPDAIYIHNPYDEFNLVTSVHPAFYSKKLKNYTDELVYIPYFILNEIDPDNQAAVQSIEHFCAVPAVVHADRVIVQSEKMRQVYINVMSKTMGEDTRIVWEKKIFGSGSPKIDKLLNTRKEDLEIPKEWMKVIEKPDGSWKKIVFYNTSVSALLTNDEKMLRKMEYVFEIFKKNRNEVALLWRPHPLVQATIESMRPKLWEEYEKIVEKYKKEGWGIYDDSADLDRAIILSDAYYGDGSSIVQLYQHIKKPIMLQNVDLHQSVFDAKSGIALNFRGYVRKGNKIYFANMEFNGLFEMDLNSHEIVHIHTFACADLSEFFCVGQYIMDYQDKLIFFVNSERSYKLCCYDLMSDKETEISFPKNANFQPACHYAFYAFVWNNKGWIFPIDMSVGCFALNLDTMEIEKDEALSRLLENHKWAPRVVKQDESTFFFVDMNQNEIIVVNVETKTKRSYKLPIQNVNGAVINGTTIWLMVADTPDVYEWDIEQNILTKYSLEDEKLWDKSDVPYIDWIYVEEQDCIVLLGGSIGYILKTNRNSRTIEIAFDFPKDFRFIKNKLQNYSFFAEVERVGAELWFYPIEGNMVLVYNIEENIVRGIMCSLPIEDIPRADEILLCELRKSVYEREAGIYALNHIIDLVNRKWECSISI